jgi:hypothetical protein
MPSKGACDSSLKMLIHSIFGWRGCNSMKILSTIMAIFSVLLLFCGAVPHA